MVLGKDIRLNRILKNGKMLCVPMDHGISSGPLEGIKDINKFIYDTENSGLTCILVNKGIIKILSRPINIGLIAHMSGQVHHLVLILTKKFFWVQLRKQLD